jgi:hypothetical protein
MLIFMIDIRPADFAGRSDQGPAASHAEALPATFACVSPVGMRFAS